MSAEGSGHQATPDKGRAGEDPCHRHACPETLSGLEQTGAAGESPHIKTESEEPHPEETLQEDRVQGTHSWAPLSQGSREKAPFLPARALPCPQVPLLACQGKTRDRQMAAALLSAWTQMPVTFEDVALYLSQEEWGRLDHAQQNCYRDILQRTTGLSLGPGSPTEAYHHQTGTLLPGFLWADPSGPPKFRPRRRPPACTHTLKMRQEPYTGGRRSPPLPWRPLRMQSPWGAPKGSAGRTRMRGRWIPQRRDPRGPPQRMRPRAARAARRHPRARPAGRPSAASSAVKASAGTRTWPRTGARTRARSPTPARTAASASAAARTSSSTRSSTRARSPTPARPAGRASATTPRSSSTSASTRARNPTCANAAPSASRAARTWSRTRAPTRAPSRTSARCAPSASRRARRSSRTSARTPASSPTRARSAASASASAPTSSRTTARTRARSPTTASTAARASATART